MSESEQELYQAIYAMAIADVRNELELYNLPSTGTKTACCQRLYKHKRQFISPREYKSKTPVVTKMTTRQSARNQVDINTNTKEPGSSVDGGITQTTSHLEQASNYLFEEESAKEVHVVQKEHIDDVKSTLEDFEHRIEQNLEKKFETYMAQWGEKFSQMLADKQQHVDTDKSYVNTAYKVAETPQNTSTPLELKFKGTDLTLLLRKQKFFGTTIEVICQEICNLNHQEKSRKEMENASQRLKSLELDYSNIVQALITDVADEELVNEEIQKWALFQQRILQVSSMADKYISNQVVLEESERRHTISIEQRSSAVGNLRLPKFTLTDFTGNILQWVSWWDQYKICIHENEMLTDRDRFNYLRMYVKGTARRAIEFIEVSSENYSKAIDALQKRFGRKRLVIEHLVDSLLNLEKKDKVDARSLRDLYDTMVNRYHTLESYEPNLKYAHRILVPILQSKLPNEIRRKWELQLSKLENEKDDLKVTVEYLFEFLRSYVMSEEAAEKSCPQEKSHVRSKKRDFSHKGYDGKDQTEGLLYSATALPSSSNANKEERGQPNTDCNYCGNAHDIQQCFLFRTKSIDERLQFSKKKALCFNCLLPDHYSSNCTRPGCSVEGCKRKHNALLHRIFPSTQDKVKPSVKDQQKENPSDHITSHTGISKGLLSTTTNSQVMLLPSAVVNLVSNGVTVPVRILVDSGSDQSYIRKEVAESLNLKTNGPLKTMTILMHGGQSRTAKVKNVSFQLSTKDGRQRVNLNAWAVSTVCSPLEPAFINVAKYPHLQGLQIADTFPRGEVPIDILIGANQWSKIIKSGVKKGRPNTPVAMNSRFGWLLSGPTGVERPSNTSCNTSSYFARTQIIEDDSNAVLKKFWQLESLGIIDHPQELSHDETYVVQQFQQSVSFDGTRYEVELPWKQSCPKLVDNKRIAMKRLINVEARLNKIPEQAVMYKESISQYIQDGHARETTIDDDQAEKIHYLPHHPVFRTDKSTTKCRAVFDASAKNQEGISLNYCLLPGPALQPDLVSILLRFRLHRVAMMADVRKMFLQVKVALKDQNVHRFLWRNMDPNQDVKTYCMTRLPFGDISSLFLATATMHHHAESNSDKFPEAAKVIEEDTYVDDCLTGAIDEESAFALYRDLVKLMHSGGFDLVKWTTNSRELLTRIPNEQRVPDRIVCLDSQLEPLKALGLSWETDEDVFLFHQGNKLLEIADPETKRSLVSISSKLFDPLGFLSPFTIQAKIMYQEVWLLGLSWDAPLTREIREQWMKWKSELKELDKICVCRSFLTNLNLHVIEVQLHGFSDASPKAYGAVTYMRLRDGTGNVVVHLLMAKSRVAPTKRVTLPRLELTAAYLLSKLVQFALKSLKMNIGRYVCWSDSMITLGWIRRPSHSWKTFVANRVQTIQENVAPEHWRFCPGESNPADLVTRGQSLQSLAHDSLWWHGPEWLCESAQNWPSDVLSEESNDFPESKQGPSCNVAFSRLLPSCIQESRIQRWTRLIRITALVFKSVRLFKGSISNAPVNQNNSPEITAEHLDEAKIYWYQKIQKEIFPEEWHCLREKKALPPKSPLISLSPTFDETFGLI